MRQDRRGKGGRRQASYWADTVTVLALAPTMRWIGHLAAPHPGMLIDVAMRGCGRALSLIPRRWRYTPADVLTALIAPILVRQRPVIARNLSAVLNCSPANSRASALARHSIRNFGRMAIDFLIVSTWPPHMVRQWVTVQGDEHLQAALRAGRGAIFALPHLGSWDVAAAFFPAGYGLRLTVVTESDWAARLVAESREERGVTLIARGNSLRALFRALAGNQCVALLCDIAKEGLPSAEAPFFGHPAPFPLGPARLSLRTGAPILVVACVRRPDGAYLLEAQPPLWPAHYGEGDDAARALTADVAAGFQRVISAHPAQWYPFHPIWSSR